MKRWLFITVMILIAFLIASTVIYANATEPLREAKELAIKIAEQEVELSELKDFQLFNGEHTYYVMSAKNADNQDVYIWISEKDHKVWVRNANSGVTEEEAVQSVRANRNLEEVISVRLGITRIQKTDRPAWEVYYKSENGHLNYYYVDFETGEKLRAIDNF